MKHIIYYNCRYKVIYNTMTKDKCICSYKYHSYHIQTTLRLINLANLLISSITLNCHKNRLMYETWQAKY